MLELWKDIEGYEKRYQISNFGRIKSLRRNIILKQQVDKAGYHYVVIDKVRLLLVHRCVAKAFLPNPNNYKYVNHIDEDKSNNCVDNLEWCTFKYNCNYGHRNEKISKSKWKPILQFDLDGNFLKEWDSIDSASNYYSVYRAGISACCRNMQKTAYGFQWRYKEERVA